MFPGANANVYYNEAGEPLGWDYDPPDDDPGDPYDDYDRFDYDDEQAYDEAGEPIEDDGEAHDPQG